MRTPCSLPTPGFRLTHYVTASHLVVACSLILPLSLYAAHKPDPNSRKPQAHAQITIAEAAASAWDDGTTVSLQIQLANHGQASAREVHVSAITLEGASYQGPAPLPLLLGTIEPGQDAIIDAILASPADGTPRVLTVSGEYRTGREHRRFNERFTIAPDATPPAPVLSISAETTKQDPNSASYPLVPPPAVFGPNAEAPFFLPLGPDRQLFEPTPSDTSISTSPASAHVRIPVNTTMLNAGVPPDPNAAAASPNGVVLATYNTGISFSTDGGKTFTDVNLLSAAPGNPLRTTFYPESDGGLCCDQVVVYSPKLSLFLWLLQYNPVTVCATSCVPAPGPTSTFAISQSNRLRIAWASPAAIQADFWNAWTYVDLTGPKITGVSDGLGIPSKEWLDYPDLALSDTFLYVGIDHAKTLTSVYPGRRIVARLSLADIVNTAAAIVRYDRAELKGSNGLNKTHFVQGAPGRMVVGSLDNSSTMRVFTWLDTAPSIPSATVAISKVQQGASYTSKAPDGSDWISVSFPGNITGATYRSFFLGLGVPPRDEYLFAFDAGVNAASKRPNSYVRLETLTPSNNGFKAVAEYDIWNNNYAYALAALGTVGNDVAFTLGVGGGTVGYPQFSVGFKDDFAVIQVTNSNAAQIKRFGDYLPTRLIPQSAGLFAAETYDVILNPLPSGVTTGTCASVGCTASMRFVQFGRPLIE